MAKSQVILAIGIVAVVGGMVAVLTAQGSDKSAQQIADSGDTRPRFDVATLKPCAPNTGPGRGGTGIASPTRVRIDCQNFFSLMRVAYQIYADGRVNTPGTYPTLEPFNEFSPKAPTWMRTMLFTIEAVSERTPSPSPAIMRGPMLQTLLEERFKLKMHRESREVPVYEMIVAQGGAKVKPLQPGSCVPYDRTVSPSPPPLETGQRRCRNSTARDPTGTAYVESVEALTLDALADSMTESALGLASAGVGDGRAVINRTGISGFVSFRVIYTDRDSYVAALKDQLGLELRPTRARRDFLVIDHVEQPSPDQ
jgi:uncharacterized protein (TIGR03435 family)